MNDSRHFTFSHSSLCHRLGTRARQLTRGAFGFGTLTFAMLAYLALVGIGAALWQARLVGLIALTPAFLACLVDARVMKLPNPLLAASLPGVVALIVYDAWDAGPARILGHIGGALVATTISLIAHYSAHFGAGDVKLAAILGLFLGTPLEGAAMFLVAILAAGVYACIRYLTGALLLTFRPQVAPVRLLASRIPFGPWLFLATLLVSLLPWAPWAPSLLS